MSLLNVFNISGTAMSAQSVRMNVTASNMANADAISSSIDQTYKARHPVFETILDDFNFGDSGTTGGVRIAGVIESQAEASKEYQPGNPLADEEGYIYRPNVNIIEEMANMIAASRNYQTNVEMVNASKRMLTETLSIGRG